MSYYVKAIAKTYITLEGHCKVVSATGLSAKVVDTIWINWKEWYHKKLKLVKTMPPNPTLDFVEA